MFDQLHSYITSVACTDPRRGTIMDGGGGGLVCIGFGPPRLGVGDMAKISLYFF